jgi:hypothetical protein
VQVSGLSGPLIRVHGQTWGTKSAAVMCGPGS